MKINFTLENEKRLKELFLDLGFGGTTLPGKFGANSYNVIQLLHTTDVTTLQGMYISLEKDIETIGKVDKWTAPVTTNNRIIALKKWFEFVDLLIGYKMFMSQERVLEESYRKEKAAKLAILTKAKEAKEIERINSLSQEELDAEIAKLSD